jgi:hypothetical protein
LLIIALAAAEPILNKALGEAGSSIGEGTPFA